MSDVSPPRRSHGLPIVSLACLTAIGLLACSSEPEVASGKNISIEYTLTLGDGTVFENNVGQAPLSFEYGTGQILPELEEAILGMHADESKTVQIKPDMGGGMDPHAVREIRLRDLPADSRQVGAWIAAHDETGAQQMLRVDSINEKTAILKADNPLTGKTLSFYVKVLSIE